MGEPQPCMICRLTWLRDNTPEDSRVMSWWDYGYQINGIANRTTMILSAGQSATVFTTAFTAASASSEQRTP